MIMKLILKIIIFVVGGLIQILLPQVPTIQLTMYIADFLELISDYFQFGFNFLYFLLGDAVYPFITFILGLFTFKYIVFPILVIVRRVFIKGGDT